MFTIQGYSFVDMNGNGTYDPDDPGISGVVIELFLGNKLIDQTRTDQAGHYTFIIPKPGTYTCREVIPRGYIDTTPIAVTYILKQNTDMPNINFGNARPATIEGLVYDDRDQDGRLEIGERPLGGWTISLRNAGNTIRKKMVTGKDGVFKFTDLPPGDYMVAESLKAGYRNTSLRSRRVTVISGQVLNVTSSFGLFGNVPFDKSKMAYVANEDSDTVSVIDTSINTVVATIPVGSKPYCLAIKPDGTRIYVANLAGRSISVIDAFTNTVVATIPMEHQNPIGIAFKPDGTRIYVSDEGGRTVYVLDAATNTVIGSPITVGFLPYSIAFKPDGTRAYVANDESDSVSVIDTATNTVIATIPVDSGPVNFAVKPDGTRLYVTNEFGRSVSVIDTAANTVIATIPAGEFPLGIAITPDGTRIYVTNDFSQSVSVIDTATNAVIGSPIPVGVQPDSVAIKHDGTCAYVANFGSGTVSVIDTATNMVLGSPIPIGASPQCIAINHNP